MGARNFNLTGKKNFSQGMNAKTESKLDDRACVREALSPTQISYVKTSRYIHQKHLPMRTRDCFMIRRVLFSNSQNIVMILMTNKFNVT